MHEKAINPNRGLGVMGPKPQFFLVWPGVGQTPGDSRPAGMSGS